MFLDGQSPFGLAPADKEHYLAGQLADLLAHHRAGCPPYARLVADCGAQRRAAVDGDG